VARKPLAFACRFADLHFRSDSGFGDLGVMLLVRTYVAQSAIEGVGVFAAEPIARGTPIWRLEPEFDRLIPLARYRSAPPFLKEFIDRYAYPSPDHPGHLVFEFDNGRFMNHSDTPNTDFSATAGGVALRNIAPGEELTCNYGEFYSAFELLPGAAEMADREDA
jgi:SET domain-containing protein